MTISPIIVIGIGGILVLALLALAFAGPSTAKAQSRRLEGIKDRHGDGASFKAEAQMRRIIANRPMSTDSGYARFIPNPALLQQRLDRTGKSWSLGRYLLACLGLVLVVGALIYLEGAPLLLAILGGTAVGLLLPHMVIGYLISKRIGMFNANFPDGIELIVRGLRSGLPISETLTVVASEIPGPVGVEFKAVTDKVKIGKTMDEALQDTANRLGTAEFQFFCITLAIQRETGGNLAETLSNLATVLRQRAQMKLKIKAMSSESKASAYIVGSLPFIVFGLVWMMNPQYLGGFFVDERLMVAGIGGLIWMSIGGAIMAKMVNFEI
jgi:tight adherence protein B